MIVVKKKNIEPGDLVAYRDRIYMAVSWDKSMPCASQCHLFKESRCTGYCYRWANGEEVVFRDIIAQGLTKATTEVVDCSLLPDFLDGYQKELLSARKRASKARAAAKLLVEEGGKA